MIRRPSPGNEISGKKGEEKDCDGKMKGISKAKGNRRGRRLGSRTRATNKVSQSWLPSLPDPVVEILDARGWAMSSRDRLRHPPIFRCSFGEIFRLISKFCRKIFISSHLRLFRQRFCQIHTPEFSNLRREIPITPAGIVSAMKSCQRWSASPSVRP